MPALGMAQETGKVLQWFKAEGESVAEGEPLLEVETDKVTVEIEAPASGVLANVTAGAGAEVPVGQAIAEILVPGESASKRQLTSAASSDTRRSSMTSDAPTGPRIEATPVARRIAAEHNLDLRRVKPEGGRVEKADVLAYLDAQSAPKSPDGGPRLRPASPKARRLAGERGIDIARLDGSGPDGAVLTADVLAAETAAAPAEEPRALTRRPEAWSGPGLVEGVSSAWRVMAERVTQSWTSVPHFYLLREVNAGRLITWREKTQKRFAENISYTDLLLKLVAAALREHPRVNARWHDGVIILNDAINVGLAVAVEDGLIVPVIHRADELSLSEIAARREDLVARAQAGKLRPEDIRDGTFTVSNLGMYGVDAFNAVVNPPQAAILAVGRIAERVVPVDGRPAVQPMMMLSLSCDHRVVDGARGAQFLSTLVDLIEEPLGLLD
jgi:pyruvate dehydrogenase E2 component (dihydrolipoamide acetyltransferase)